MTQRLSIVIPFYGEAERVEHCGWSLARSMADPERAEVIIIDNDPCRPPDPYVRHLAHLDVRHVRRESNAGFPASCNEGLRAAGGDVVLFLHNDVLLMEYAWDRRLKAVLSNDAVGLAGFCGARVALADGGRHGVFSNLYEAERHGSRHRGDIAVAVLDSFAVACRRDRLLDWGGWDEGYGPCHYADKDLSLQSLSRGLVNLCVGVYCLHHGGVTSGAAPYRDWADVLTGAPAGQGDMEVWRRGHGRYLDKWRHFLPRSV